MSGTRTFAPGFFLLACSALAGAQEPSLPEGNAYVRSVLSGGRPQDAAINDYSYDVEETRERLDGAGKATSRESKKYEVYFVHARPVRRLVSRNGVALGQKEQAEVDAKAASLAKAIAEGRTVSELPGVRLGSLLDSFDFKTVGRESRNGRATLVLDFLPREDAPRSPSSGRASEAVTKILTGRLEIDEADKRVVRLEAHNAAGRNASVATGVKLGGFELLMEYAPVEDSVWLPRKVMSVATGRAFFFRTFRVRQTTTYSNFRKFKVETDERRHYDAQEEYPWS